MNRGPPPETRRFVNVLSPMPTYSAASRVRITGRPRSISWLRLRLASIGVFLLRLRFRRVMPVQSCEHVLDLEPSIAGLDRPVGDVLRFGYCILADAVG